MTASIASIPDIYVEDFSGLVNEIQAQIPPCEEPDDRMEEDEDGNGKGRGKGKKKDKKDKNDG